MNKSLSSSVSLYLSLRRVWHCRSFYLRQPDCGQFQDGHLPQLWRRNGDGWNGWRNGRDGWRNGRNGRNAHVRYNIYYLVLSYSPHYWSCLSEYYLSLQIHIRPCTVCSLDRWGHPGCWRDPEVNGVQRNGER